MFKRCNTANAVFRGQPEELVSVFAHFCIARRSFSEAELRSSRALNCTKTVTSGGVNHVEIASCV
jgi:hypothetical protein